MFPTRSAVFEAFVNPALARAEIWRLIAGALLAIIVWVAFLALTAGALVGALYLTSPDLAIEMLDAFQDQDSPISVAFFLTSFLGFVAGIAVTVRFLHKRPFASIFGPSQRILWRHYLLGLGVVGILVTVASIFAAFTEPLIPNLPIGAWLAWLPVTLVLLFIQTGTEELFFRGYILQQFAARFTSRWMWWVLPSALFGAMHYNPSIFGSNAMLVVAAATMMGLILSDVTARSGNISLAMGMHFANNFAAIALIGLPGQLSGLSLYHSPLDMTDTAAVRAGLLLQVALLVGFYIVYLVFLARRLPRDPQKADTPEQVFE